MPRIKVEEDYVARRNEILDVALRLLYCKGYERMTIQDILDELQISKGAFYHYYDSKAEVLNALIERMAVEQVEPLFISIVNDPHLTALQKLQCYFDTGVTWKTAKKDLMIELVKIWYSDENALARQKMLATMERHTTPWFGEIIRQGNKEGVFKVLYPEYAPSIIINLVQPLGDAFAQMLLSEEVKGDHILQKAKALIATYNDAMERFLGAPKGSIHLMDTNMLKEWFPSDNGINHPMKKSISQRRIKK